LYYGFTNSQDHIFRIGATVEKKNKYRYFIQPIGKDGKAYKAKVIGSYEKLKRNEVPYVEALVSPDSTKYVFLNIRDSDRDKEKFHFAINVYDNQLNKPYKRQFNFGQFENQMDIVSADVNNQGSVFIVTKEFLTDGTLDDYKIKVYMVKSDDPNVQQIDFERAAKYITYVKIAAVEDGQVAAMGIYKNKMKDKPQGYHYMLIDTLGETVVNTKQIFPRVKKQYFSHGSSVTSISEPILTSEGQVIVTLEDNYFGGVTMSTGLGITKNNRDHVSKNILVTSLSSSGKLKSLINLPKNQVNSNKLFNSHEKIYLPDSGFYFFYNDKASNIDLSADEQAEQLLPIDKSSLVCSFINEAGEIKKLQLLSEKQTGTILVPGSLTKLTSRTYAFLTAPENPGLNFFRLGSVRIK